MFAITGKIVGLAQYPGLGHAAITMLAEVDKETSYKVTLEGPIGHMTNIITQYGIDKEIDISFGSVDISPRKTKKGGTL